MTAPLRHAPLLALLLTALTCSPAGASEPPASRPEAPAFADCALSGNGGATRVAAECVTLEVPLDPSHPAGEQIKLRIARLQSLAPEPARDAFTVINGGPGGSSIDLFADFAPFLTPILRERDIVIVDQRGTGDSTQLTCPALEQEVTDYDPDTTAALAAACIPALPADPAFFTTSVAVRDLDYVRALLGYDQLTLYGVSYGTRVAQHYAKRHPAETRALIIDGVVPLSMALGPQISENAQDTLNAIFVRCAASESCREAFPALPELFAALGDDLRQNPPTLTLPHPTTGQQETLTLSYAHLAVAIRLLSYGPETAALIPLLISEAQNIGNYLPLASQALRITSQLSEALSYGMHNAVVCTEDVPSYRFDPAERAAGLANTYLGGDQLRSLVAICSRWPAGVIDPEFHEPLATDIPTLLLSGEFDPITPPANAEQTLKTLSNARHLIAPGQGHGVVMRGCLPGLLAKFVESRDPGALDASCVDRLGPEPFFIDLMGPGR
jgi:pimeloyl-ACP methyl ester carboxylesterase